MGELVQRAISQLEKAYENKNSITGVPSGFTDFDSKTCGLQPGELIIIAARPSMGKTALTLNIASYVAVRKNIPVAVFSLEMGAEQLVQRLLGAQAGIDLSRIRKGQIKSTEWTDMARAAGELSEAPVYIDETPGLSIAELRTKARRMHHEHGIQLLIIDYLQLMSGPPGYENKATEVGEISKGLKSLARELSIPVIALSQLNRGVESRTDKRPMMSDLRESGAIEQDADLIAFLYREEYYLKDKTPEDKIGVAELIIGKHRNGPTGTLELQFKSELTRFENLTRQYDDYVP
jgi:replicative DNA helicase